MKVLSTFIDKGLISRIRRNHALEHATLQILAQKDARLRLAGYSDGGGFWVVGRVDTLLLKAAANEGLDRLRAGETGLAIHPTCGTNFAIAGLFAGSLAWLGMLVGGHSLKAKLDRWPGVVMLATIGVIISQPLGPKIQARVTTKADPERLEIFEIIRREKNESDDIPVHRIRTRDQD
ncbi:MAG: DUF6391 domain-containing protein [Anaerolineaceae bacterium]